MTPEPPSASALVEGDDPVAVVEEAVARVLASIGSSTEAERSTSGLEASAVGCR